jgi:hypothetical protein
MTVVAVVFFPVVLAYQGWSLYVFRKRVTSGPAAPGPDSPGAGSASPAAGSESTAVGEPNTA